MEEQIGEGVLTRKQARLQQLTQSNDNGPNQLQVNKDSAKFDDVPPESGDLAETPRVGQNAVEEQGQREASPVPGPSKAKEDEQGPSTAMEDDEVEDPKLYNSETLVAENEDLKAYVIKTYFRKLKNFE